MISDITQAGYGTTKLSKGWIVLKTLYNKGRNISSTRGKARYMSPSVHPEFGVGFWRNVCKHYLNEMKCNVG